MSGSGGDRGYDYQADGYAYVAAHGLAGQPLNWFDDNTDVPVAILMETGGAGDDQQITTVGGRRIELQAKHALKRGDDLFETVRRMARALNDDTDLRAAIMVDRHASETITEDLRKDIIRLGQGRRDDLKEITNAVLADLKAQAIPAIQTFPRLRVVVVDLDEGSDGATAACAMLGKVVAPASALTAYKILGKRGHWLTKNRGRDVLHGAAEQLNNELGLRPDALSPITEVVRFRQWVHATTREFYSPALGKRFPIDQAWNAVRTLDATGQSTYPQELQASTRDALVKAILRYQEWHRLAEKSSDDRTSTAVAFMRLNKHAVLVGGPGAGKSTLGRQLTHELNSTGKLAVRVRLKSVATMIARGQTFDEAMRTAAVDGSGVTAESAAALLASPDDLIADGLDECDPIRIDVATGLKAWADGRPSTSVCVLTRPVGHVPDLLPGFAHAELLPLDKGAIRSRVHWFTAALIPDPAMAVFSAETFLDAVVEKSRTSVASIASRNPLLLTFLVRLHVDGVRIASRRAPLFESIIELMIKSQLIDRPQGKTVDRATAWRAAEVLGWECLERPESSVAELTARVAEAMGSSDDADRLAEAAIAFWEEHGLIERLTLGSLDAITFVHPALGEYAAGRHLSRFEPKLLSSEIIRVRRQAKYREPILLGAGCGAGETVVAALLNNDDPWDPISTEAVLAAAALAEIDSGEVRAETTSEVLEHLQQRLESSVPLVAIEAGLGLMPIALLAPEVVGSSSAALWNHPQEWTQLAARAVCLAAGTKFVDISTVAQMLADFVPQLGFRFRAGTTAMPNGAYDLQEKMLPHAVERVITELDPVHAEPLLKEFFESKGLSVGMVGKLGPVVRSSRYYELFEQARRSESSAELLDGFLRGTERLRRADRAFLECALKAAGVERRPESVAPDHSHALAALLAAMQYWKSILPDWQVLSSASSLDVVTEVIRGAIAAVRLPRAELGTEVNSALDRSELHDSSISMDVPMVQLEPDWSQAVTAPLNPVLLAAALHMPCWPIAVTAAELLATGVGGEEAKNLVQKVLETGKDRAILLAGAVVREIFGQDAFEVLNTRLLRGPLTRGCGFLYSHVLRAASPEQLETAIDRAIEGLKSKNGRVAHGAAQMLVGMEHGRLRPRIDQLREAMQRWTDLGSWCDRCDVAVKSGSCPECSVVAPTPRSALIPVLTQLGALSVDDLIKLANDPWHDVPKAARESLSKLASTNRPVMASILEKVFNRQADLQILDAVLALPTQSLRVASDLLLGLLQSPHPDVRARTLLALSGSWIDREIATYQARIALNDPSPAVRNSATLVLRALAD